MQASPSAPNEAVDKASSILLLSPTLELARAFLSGLFAHCGLPLPDGVPTTLSWADRARWSISNKYYEAEVDFVLRQVFAEVGTIAEDDVDDHTEGDEAKEAGYPAVVLLVSAAQLQTPDQQFRVPQEVKTAFVEEKPDVSLAFALALPGDAHAADEERDEAVLEAFLDLGIEYISSQSAEADEDHTPPPFEQVVQSLSSHMWPSLALKPSANGKGANSAPRAHDTISALAGLLGGMGGFSLPPGVDGNEGADMAADVNSDFSDDEDGRAFDAGYATLDGSTGDSDAEFGDFEAAPSLDGEHRQASLEFRSALISSSRSDDTTDGVSESGHAVWETFDTSSGAAAPTAVQPTRSSSLLNSFGPSSDSTLSPSDPHLPERKFSSSFAPTPTTPPRPTAAAVAETDDPTADLGAMLSHLNSLRTELAGVENDDERRRRAAAAVMALFGDDFDGEDDQP